MVLDSPFSVVAEGRAEGLSARLTPVWFSAQPPHPAQVEGRAGQRHLNASCLIRTFIFGFSETQSGNSTSIFFSVSTSREESGSYAAVTQPA